MKLAQSFTLFLVLFSSYYGNGQSSYQLRLSTEISIPSISLGLITAGYILDKKQPSITEEEIMLLNRETINHFDRGATYNWNPKLAKSSDFIMYAAMSSPLLFLAGENSRKDFLEISVISTEVFLLNTGLTYLTKSLVDRKRPYLYNTDVSMNEKLKSGANNSFFSGHTSTTAAMSYSFAFMYAKYYPDSKAKPAVWVLAAGLPALTAFFRVKSGKHYWTDVLAGYSVGAFSGWLVPYLHERK